MGVISKTGQKILESADWDTIAAKLIIYADNRICNYIWAGEKSAWKRDTVAMADGRDAYDFTQQAIKELLDHKAGRTWDDKKHPDIYEYLENAISSMINNASKHSTNKATRRQFPETAGNKEIDRFATLADSKISSPEDRESDDEQKILYDEFKEYISLEKELLDLLEAYEEGFMKNREIAELYGIHSSSVAETKRKLIRRRNKFLRTRKAKR